MAIYGIGTLAYYDSIQSGLVPVRVTGVNGRDITAVVTGARYAYPKGYILISSPTWIVPRTHVRHKRSWSPTIIGGYEYINARAAK